MAFDTDNFSGAKFGGYGSFLPAYECSPFRSHPKASQRNYMSPKSPSHHHEKAASNNSTAPSHVPPSTRRGSAPCSTNSLQNARTFSVDDSTNKGVGISSNIGAERCSLNDDSTHKSGKSTEQRTLKFRIKMKYDNLAQKNAAIYSGLGLDISPSSSMENSPVETAGMPPVSQQIGEESPAGIIQAMTSFPIPGGVLMSPLQDSMLYLTRREKILGDSKSLSALNGQEHCSLSTDESDSIIREEDVLKKRKVRILHPKKRLGKTPERKDFLFNDLKSTPLFSSFCDDGENAEIIGRASEVSKKVNKHGANSRMVSTEAVKEEVLESMSGQDFEKNSKKHMGNSSMRRVIEHNLANSLKNNCVGPNNNAHYKGPINSQKADVDVINCFIEDSQKVETNRKGKPLSDGKHKSKGDQSPSKTGGISKTDSFKAGSNAMANNKKSSSFGDDSKSKMAKTKSSMDNNAGGNSSHSLKGDKPECIVDGTDPVDGSTYDDFTNGSAFEVKMKERQSSDKMDKLMCDPGIKDALNACPVAGNKSALEMVQMAAASQLIEDNWVCCDHCQKWRLLPVGIKPEQLPEKWLCSMLNWLPPGMNRCDISEEMTTKALYASCQMSNSEGLNNIQSNAFGAAIGVRSADAPQLGHSHQNSRSDALSDQRKKKLGSKEKKKAEICIDSLLSSDSTQNHAEESGKILRHQHPAEGNLMRKPVSQHGKLNNLMEVKHMPKEKENKMNGGDGNQVKLKRKMEADRNQPRTPKKLKTGDIYIANRQLSLSVDLENAVRNSRNGFPVKANGEDVQKHDEYCLYEHVQDKLVGPVKKQGDQTQFLSDGGSLDLKSHSKKGSSLKKRRLEDWQDADKLQKMLSLQDDKQYGERSVSGSRKEKKFKVLNPEAKLFTESEYKINRKGEMSQVSLPGIKNHASVGAEVGSVDKVYPPRKHIEKVASHKVSDCFDPLGRDLGSGVLSLAATSSSSKVSGSHKCRTNHADMKGSPVESVTSSPLNIPNDREGKLSVKVKEERVSCDLHSDSIKFASIMSQVGDAKDNVGIQAKTSKVRDDHLLNFDVATVQHGDCANYESIVNKSNQEAALSWKKSGKVTSLRGKEEDRRSGSAVDRNKNKVSASKNDYFKNGGRQESAVEPNYDAKNDAKCSFAKSKCKGDNIGKKNSVRYRPSEIGKQTELRRKDSEKSDPKVDASFSATKEIFSQENLIQDLEDGNKANTVCTESRNGKLKVLSPSVGEEKRETLSGSIIACESKRGDTCIEHQIHASSNGDVGTLMKISADARSKGGVNCGSGISGSDWQLPVTTPVRTNSSQTAYDTLKEATNLKDRADHFKNSGFEFESNETFFEAALKFLHGASLLENFLKESSKHGNISQMQAYMTAAKLFTSCANEYERRHETAAAALAYKCMEVAYMRVVYSKHSSINRDRDELQSTLQMVPQGESPSSSASDVDNLNNQAPVDRFTLLRGTGTHVAGNQVISAQHRSNFARLLDFTQDVNYAMEASRKCQCAFAAANMIMEEARNGDCITSMRKVIDLSFQDVDELVGLVWTATKAISRAHLSGARD